MISLDEAELKFSGVLSHLEEELKKIRAGRPSPDQFANIDVEAYGSVQKLQAVANVNVIDATLVTVQVWDKSLQQAVAKALQQPPQNFNPQIGADNIRIPIAPMNMEKREQLVKLVREQAEQSKIQVRLVRKDAMDGLEADKKSGVLPEDDFTSKSKQVQQWVDNTNSKIDSLIAAKEVSIMTV